MPIWSLSSKKAVICAAVRQSGPDKLLKDNHSNKEDYKLEMILLAFAVEC